MKKKKNCIDYGLVYIRRTHFAPKGTVFFLIVVICDITLRSSKP